MFSAIPSTVAETLKEIEILKRDACAEAPDPNRIYELEQRFNWLMDEEEGAKSRPRSETCRDPFMILPPELWPAIMIWDQDELLVWTLVSTHWCTAILSVRGPWKSIELETGVGDLGARIALCLEFSAGSNLSIRSTITADQWEEFIPLLAPETHRIGSLDVRARYDETVDYMKILRALGKLPNLNRLYLSQEHWPHTMHDWQAWRPKRPACPTTFHRIISSCSSLEWFYEVPFTAEDLKSEACLRLGNISLYAMEDSWEELCRLPLLESLDLYDGADEEHSMTSRSPEAAGVLPLRKLLYTGRNLPHALEHVSLELRYLNGKYIHFNQLPRLLVVLSQFSHLTSLTLEVWLDSAMPLLFDGEFSLQSVTTLWLSFNCDWYALRQPGDMLQQQHILAKLFHTLISKMPAVEYLTISRSTSTPSILRYACSLSNLRWFLAYNIVSSTELEGNDTVPTSFSSSSLQYIEWRGECSSDIINLFVGSSTRRLGLDPTVVRAGDGPYLTLEQPPLIMPPRLRTPLGQLSKITELSLVIAQRFACDLEGFPALRHLHLQGGPSVTLGSDLLEDIIIRPDICPRLDTIGITGNYLDWDVLLLMLERRNILAKSETNRISEISIDAELPYRLLYPISVLLGGRYPEREDLANYSISALQTTILDPNTLGCNRCVRMFRQCDSPFLGDIEGPRYEMGYDTDIPIITEYPGLPDYSRADPPLSQGVVAWLQGKHQRRMIFVKMRKEVKFWRKGDCRPWPWRTMHIRSGTLHGAAFAESSTEDKDT